MEDLRIAPKQKMLSFYVERSKIGESAHCITAKQSYSGRILRRATLAQDDSIVLYFRLYKISFMRKRFLFIPRGSTR